MSNFLSRIIIFRFKTRTCLVFNVFLIQNALRRKLSLFMIYETERSVKKKILRNFASKYGKNGNPFIFIETSAFKRKKITLRYSNT